MILKKKSKKNKSTGTITYNSEIRYFIYCLQLNLKSKRTKRNKFRIKGTDEGEKEVFFPNNSMITLFIHKLSLTTDLHYIGVAVFQHA